MATRKVPPSQAPEEARILPEEVGFQLWYVPEFPLARMGGRLDKDVDAAPWLLGLLDDIRREGRFRNPVIVWNHHRHRGGKQPEWLLRAGSNRVWCAEQLGWTHVPAVVSHIPAFGPDVDGPNTYQTTCFGSPATRIGAAQLPHYFPDGGKLWANRHGFGLLAAKKPELTYAEYRASDEERAAIRHTAHRRSKIINPLQEA